MRTSTRFPGMPIASDQASRDHLRAWAAVIVMLALFAAASSIMTALDLQLSFAISMLLFGALVAVLLVLAATAIRLGLRARRLGVEAGITPAVVGGAIGGFFLLLAVATLVGHLFGFE